MLGDGFRRRHHVGHVRLTMLGERRRHAEDNDIGIAQSACIRRRDKLPVAHQRRDRRIVDAFEVRFPCIQTVDLHRIDVIGNHAVTLGVRGNGEWKPDIPHAHNGDGCIAISYTSKQ